MQKWVRKFKKQKQPLVIVVGQSHGTEDFAKVFTLLKELEEVA